MSSHPKDFLFQAKKPAVELRMRNQKVPHPPAKGLAAAGREFWRLTFSSVRLLSSGP
jgi:hypothetical protein